jgi:hypothetical protein
MTEEVQGRTIDTTERWIDACIRFRETSILMTWKGITTLTHGFIDIPFECRILGISRPELADNVGLVQVEIHNVDDS